RGLRGTVSTARLDEVVPALKEVEREVARGAHAAGFLSYEAAPALDRALVTHPPRPGQPLLWFGLCAERGSAPEIPSAAGGGGARLGAWESTLTPAEHARRVDRIRGLIARG